MVFFLRVVHRLEVVKEGTMDEAMAIISSPPPPFAPHGPNVAQGEAVSRRRMVDRLPLRW